MNRKVLFQRPALIILSFLVAIFANSCQFSNGNVTRGSGTVSSVSYPVSYFNSIELSGAYNVTLIRGDELVVTVETDENLQELVGVNVNDEKLEITTEKGSILRPSRMELQIIYPEIQYLAVNGAGKISAREPILTESLFLKLSGAADLHLEIEAVSLRTKVSGAGNISLRGKVEDHNIELSGASNFDATSLITRATSISLSGAGSAEVYASEKLEATLSGVGRISYYGNPKEKTINKSGVGSIRSAE